MIIFVCRRVSNRDIFKMSCEGTSFDDLQMELDMATHYGRCRIAPEKSTRNAKSVERWRFVGPVHISSPLIMLQPA
jgi:bacterioferritin-associated ferredoxin